MYTRVRECVGSACVMWVCMDGGRYIGWPYFYNLLVGPSYIPSPVSTSLPSGRYSRGRAGNLDIDTPALPHAQVTKKIS